MFDYEAIFKGATTAKSQPVKPTEAPKPIQPVKALSQSKDLPVVKSKTPALSQQQTKEASQIMASNLKVLYGGFGTKKAEVDPVFGWGDLKGDKAEAEKNAGNNANQNGEKAEIVVETMKSQITDSNPKPFKDKGKRDNIWAYKNKAGGNFKSSNMKHKYKDRFLGNTFTYKTRYMANGRKKSFYKPKPGAEQPDDQIDHMASSKIDVTKLLEQENQGVISKDNIYFKFINESVKLQIMREDVYCDNVETLIGDKLSKLIVDDNPDNALFSFFNPESPSNYDDDKVLKHFFGFEKFYDFQTQALNLLRQSEAGCFVNSFTGSGKSLVFQYYALTNPGMTVVIAPYVSIVVDQVKKAPKDLPTLAINSWLSMPQRKRLMDLVLHNKVKLLFITPELFVNDFAHFLILHKDTLKLNLLCIDEAHCCLLNSPTYRSSYSSIRGIKAMIEKHTQTSLKVLLLTATANHRASDFLCNEFQIPTQNVISTGIYIRENFEILFKETVDQRKDILQTLTQRFVGKRPILVFCNFTRSTQSLSTFLTQNRIKSLCFHGELSEVNKLTILENLAKSFKEKKPAKKKAISILEDSDIYSKIEVIMTTISLSMGLDVPFIEGIIHFNFPKYLENYIQQIGRAGRDGNLGYCETLLNKEDYYFCRSKTISDYFINHDSMKRVINFVLEPSLKHPDSFGQYAFVSKEAIKRQFGMTYDEFCRTLNIIKLVLQRAYELELEVQYSARHDIQVKFYEGFANGEPSDDPYYIAIKKTFRKEKYGYGGNLFSLCNFMGEDSYAVVAGLEKITLANNGAVIFDEQSAACRVSNYSHHPISSESASEIFSAAVQFLKEDLSESLLKMDVFYFMCSYLAKTNNNAASIEGFKTIARIYFEEEESNIRTLLSTRFNYKNLCPMIFVENANDFESVMSTFSNYYSKYFKQIVGCFDTGKTSYEVFADFMRFLLGVTSSTFDFGSWFNCDGWGALRHYSFEQFYGEIEQVFVEAHIEWRASKNRQDVQRKLQKKASSEQKGMIVENEADDSESEEELASKKDGEQEEEDAVFVSGDEDGVSHDQKRVNTN
jgi:superfamily II DNA/RNA helicase